MNADRVIDDASDKSSSVGSVEGFKENDVDLASFRLSAPQRILELVVFTLIMYVDYIRL